MYRYNTIPSNTRSKQNFVGWRLTVLLGCINQTVDLFFDNPRERQARSKELSIRTGRLNFKICQFHSLRCSLQISAKQRFKVKIQEQRFKVSIQKQRFKKKFKVKIQSKDSRAKIQNKHSKAKI